MADAAAVTSRDQELQAEQEKLIADLRANLGPDLAELVDFLHKYMFDLGYTLAERQQGRSGLDRVNFDQEPPLVVACRWGLTDIVVKLMQAGADVNQADAIPLPNQAGKATPLIKASQYGHTDIVNTLLLHNPNLEATDHQGATALFRAAQNGREPIVSALIEAGANIGTTCQGILTPMLVAVVGKHPAVIRKLMMVGAEAKEKIFAVATVVDFTFDPKSFLLKSGMLTGEHQQLLVGLLIEYGMFYIKNLHDNMDERIDINHLLTGEIKSFSKNELVREKVMPQIAAKVIKEYWLRVDEPEKYSGQVQFTVTKGDASAATSPAAANSEAEKKEIAAASSQNGLLNKNTLLHVISGKNLDPEQYKIIFIGLLKKAKALSSEDNGLGCFIKFWQVKNANGFTPIHAAIINNNVLFLQLLIKFCQENNILPEKIVEILDDPTPSGQTPLMRAVIQERLDIARILLDAGVAVNAEDRNCATALLIACAKDLLHFVQLLRKYGASLFCIDVEGKNPFDYARDHSEPALHDYLLQIDDSQDGVNAMHLVAASQWARDPSQECAAVLSKIVGAYAQKKMLLLINRVELLLQIVNQQDRAGRNPICYAFFSKNFAFAEQIFIASSARVQFPLPAILDEFIQAPALCAAIADKCSVNFARIILAQPGINVDAKFKGNNSNTAGNTAMHFLMLHDDVDYVLAVLALLWEKNARILKNDQGFEPIDLAPEAIKDVIRQAFARIAAANQAAQAPVLLMQQQMQGLGLDASSATVTDPANTDGNNSETAEVAAAPTAEPAAGAADATDEETEAAAARERAKTQLQ